MSEENVVVVRQAWEAYNRRDNEAALALYDSAVEVDLRHAAGFDSQVYRGVDEVGDYFRDWMAYGRGKRSGVPVEMVQAHVWTVVDGKLKRLRIFATKAEALEAVGSAVGGKTGSKPSRTTSPRWLRYVTSAT